MRILTVCTSTKVFGAEVLTLKMLKGFKEAGHTQLAVTSTWTDGDFNSRLSLIGVEERRLPFGAWSKLLRLEPMRWTANTIIRLPRLWIGWSRVLREFRPDVVLFTSSRLTLPVYPWLNDKPSYLIEHSYLAPTPTRRRLYRLYGRKLTAFVAISKFMREHLISIGAPASKIAVILNGPFAKADVLRFRESPENSVNRKPRPTRVGIVGQISPNKGHHHLVEAMRILKEREKDVEVRVFGSGAGIYVTQLEERLAAYGLTSRWHWMGYESDASKIYSQLDICVMPSQHEPFGMVAIEAGAFGLPVIATSQGGLIEIIDEGVTGFLINPDNADELANRIEYLIDHPQAAVDLGLQARDKVMREFTQERMVAEYEALFVAGLSKSARAGS